MANTINILRRELRPGEWLEITPGKQIRLFGVHELVTFQGGVEEVVTPTPYERVFKIGDDAEYEAAGHVYKGKVTKITAQRITITPRVGRTTKLKMAAFHRMNWN
tara:strand:- start:1505 stop:1819 length:315 start_codon:yes stop_codon:yes gene_type:complete